MDDRLPDYIYLLNGNHRSLVTEYFSRFPSEISEHTYTNLFCWRRSRPIYIAELDDTLIFLVTTNTEKKSELVLLGPPIGKLPLEQVFMEMKGIAVGAIRLPAALVHSLVDKGYVVQKDPDNWDYVYRGQDLAGLSGRMYSKKRNQIKKCLLQHDCRYEAITDGLIPECMAMQQQWCAVRSCSREPGLCSEFQAIREMFDNFQELGLIGGCIRVDGKIQAFSVGELLHHGTAVVHFEKAMPEISGLGQLINKWFALYGLSAFEFVNREQDLGIPGLRQAKKSYHPHHLVEKHTVSFFTDTSIYSPQVGGCAEE
jgi:uncharacterized protein